MLTKGDLKSYGFDDDATKLLLWAQDKGARLKISKRGHCIVMAPDGRGTASVSRNQKVQCRTAQNSRASVRRLFERS